MSAAAQWHTCAALFAIFTSHVYSINTRYHLPWHVRHHRIVQAPSRRILHAATASHSDMLDEIVSQYNELRALVPHLSPRIQPRALLDYDFAAYLKRLPQHLQQACHVAFGAAAEQCKACEICGRPGRALPPVADLSDSGDDDNDAAAGGSPDGEEVLRLTSLWSLAIGNRVCQLDGARYCCQDCRACMDIGSFVQFTAMRAGLPECSAWDGLAGRLIRHLIAVNQVTELESEAAQQAYVHEVYCRAYALHVLVSSLPGWRMTGPCRPGANVPSLLEQPERLVETMVAALGSRQGKGHESKKKQAGKGKASPREGKDAAAKSKKRVRR